MLLHKIIFRRNRCLSPHCFLSLPLYALFCQANQDRAMGHAAWMDRLSPWQIWTEAISHSLYLWIELAICSVPWDYHLMASAIQRHHGFILLMPWTVLSFHKPLITPIFSSYTEVANCLQRNVFDTSIGSLLRGFSPSHAGQNMSVLALPSSSVVFLWSIWKPWPA